MRNQVKLAGKVAIVTGAGGRRGIGRAIALGFAREGADVAVADLDGSGAAQTSEEIRQCGRRSLGVRADVSSRAEMHELVVSTVRELGAVDILVNNAGFCHFVPFLEIDDDLWDRTMAVNVKGYFMLGQEAARQMIHQGRGGRIINISSQLADVSGEERVHYSASKGAVKLLTQGMALELARYRINVNNLAPGTIESDIVKQEHILKLVELERKQSSIPWGRMGTAEDLVGAAVFLASEDSAYMTGSTLLVDGGQRAGSLLTGLRLSP